MKYKYLSIIKTTTLTGDLIQDNHIVYGKHKTQDGFVRPGVMGTHEVIEVIELPNEMSIEQIKHWCRNNTILLNKKLFNIKEEDM